MFGALAHGLPQVVLPQGADNYVNADAVTDAKLGVALRSAELNADSIRDAVRAVLDDPSFREAASRVADEIAAMPSHEEFVADLKTAVVGG
jgi:UDP:flavonoid glycosyltransferase YjiC (YdhE family)